MLTQNQYEMFTIHFYVRHSNGIQETQFKIQIKPRYKSSFMQIHDEIATKPMSIFICHMYMIRYVKGNAFTNTSPLSFYMKFTEFSIDF